jgi:hypothetical protein
MAEESCSPNDGQEVDRSNGGDRVKMYPSKHATREPLPPTRPHLPQFHHDSKCECKIGFLGWG